MLVVTLREGESIEKALKKLKRKFDRTRTIKKYRSKQYYIKKSVDRRVSKQKAVKTLRYRVREQDL